MLISSSRFVRFRWLALAGLLATGSLRAANYYVDPVAGKDANAGTSTSTPWKTFANVNAKTNYAPGDSILLKGGTTSVGNLILTSAGTATAPITVGSYGTGRATINAQNADGVRWTNAGGIAVRDLVVTGSGTANRGSGVLVMNTAGNGDQRPCVRIDNVSASGFAFDGVDPGTNDCIIRGTGIYVGGSPTTVTKCGFSDVAITNCTAFNNQMCGIAVTGYWISPSQAHANANVVVRACTTYNNPGNVSYGDNWSGSGIFVNNTDGALIERCSAYGNGQNNPPAAPGGPVGIWTHQSNNVAIQFNESYNNTSSGSDGGGFDFDAAVTNSVIQYNYSHGNRSAGFLIYSYSGAPANSSGLTVRYNISENDAQNTYYGAVMLKTDSPAITGVAVYNNIFFGSTNTAQKLVGAYGSTGISASFWNNVFYSQGEQLVDSTNTSASVAFKGNDYYATGAFLIRSDNISYNSLAAWRATGQETMGTTLTGISANPGYANPGAGTTVGNPNNLASLASYVTTAASPLVDAGLNLNILFGIDPRPVDFYEQKIFSGTAPDVGAGEWTATRAPVVNFQDRPTTSTALTGTYDAVCWGNSHWYTNTLNGSVAAYFNSSAKASTVATFTLPAGKVLRSLKVCSLKGGPNNVTISSAGNADRVAADAGTAWTKITTNWTTAAPTVTLTILDAGIGAGNIAFDEITYDDPPTAVK